MVLKAVNTQQCESALTGTLDLHSGGNCIICNTLAKTGDLFNGGLRSLIASRRLFSLEYEASFLRLPLKAHDSLPTHFPSATAVVYVAKETIYEIVVYGEQTTKCLWLHC